MGRASPVHTLSFGGDRSHFLLRGLRAVTVPAMWQSYRFAPLQNDFENPEASTKLQKWRVLGSRAELICELSHTPARAPAGAAGSGQSTGVMFAEVPAIPRHGPHGPIGPDWPQRLVSHARRDRSATAAKRAAQLPRTTAVAVHPKIVNETTPITTTTRIPRPNLRLAPRTGDRKTGT